MMSSFRGMMWGGMLVALLGCSQEEADGAMMAAPAPMQSVPGLEPSPVARPTAATMDPVTAPTGVGQAPATMDPAGGAGGAPGVGAAGPPGFEPPTSAGMEPPTMLDAGFDGDGAGEPVSGEGAAAEGFSPCPSDGEVCKVLPLGDSITYGLGVNGFGGYRVELFRKALADGKNITFVGSVDSGPQEVDGMPFPRQNEGHSGWTVSQIDGILDRALADDPHIILLMIGTNDMYMRPDGASERFDTLLGHLVESAPDALIVAAKITPLSSFGAAEVDKYNAALPGIVDAHAAAGEHVVLVDMFTDFSTSMLADGVHPNEEGYARMAEVWYEAIKDVLP